MKNRLKIFKKNGAAAIFFSAAVSFLFVAIITSAATTINTNVNTGGTLTVSGESTLTGAVWASSTLQATGATTLYNNLTVDTSTFHVDSSNNRVGIGSTTPSIELSVAGDGYLTGGLGLGERNAVDKTILLNGLTADPTGTAGLIYYNSTNGNVRLYNGTAWGVIGTSTGFNLSGNRIQLVDTALNHMTIGTTTAQGSAVMTLEATTTSSVPLILVGRSGQTGNLFQITANGGSLGGGSNLFTVNAAGNATTSNLSASGYLWVDGYATTTGGSGNIATQGTLTVNSTSVLTGTSTITTGTNIGGGYSAGGTGATINSLGRLEVNGDLAVNGFATTTSADGNISTAGTLTVTGTSTLTTGAAIGGGYSGGGTGATINSLGRLEINGDLDINGFATTTSADGNISTRGTLTVSSTSVLTGTSTISTGAVIGGGYSQGGTGADINSLGAIWANGDIAVNGKATTTASTGAFTTENNVTVKGTASSSILIVGGDSTNGTMNGIVSGMCNITSSAAIAATSTIGVQCAANGIRVGDRVFVTATSSLPSSLAIVSASSTAANTIGLYIANINGGASVNTGVISLWFLGIR